MDTMKKMTRRTFGGRFDVAMCCDLRIPGAAQFFNGGHRWASVGIRCANGSHRVDIG
jgi:hypothetical protein